MTPTRRGLGKSNPNDKTDDFKEISSPSNTYFESFAITGTYATAKIKQLRNPFCEKMVAL